MAEIKMTEIKMADEKEDRNGKDGYCSQHWYHLHIVVLRLLLAHNLVDLENFEFELKLSLQLSPSCCEMKNVKS